MTFREQLEDVKQTYPGLRLIGHIDCTVCGVSEALYQDFTRGIFVRACPKCDYIQVVELGGL